MTKYQKQRKVVGSKNTVTKSIPKPLNDLIKKKQQELQRKEDMKNKSKKKKNKISFAWAGLQLSLEMERSRK